MIKKHENSTYFCLPGIRFVWRYGEYIGFYHPRLSKVV